MAPESLCLHEGRLDSSLGSWVGKRVIYSCCTCPPRAPAPSQAPAIRPSAATALASISLGGGGGAQVWAREHHGKTRSSTAAGTWFCSPDGGGTFSVAAGQPLVPGADVMGKTREGECRCFQEKGFFFTCFPPGV